jgi:hypothetical protein
VLPQHGPGRKHERPIVLTAWQRELVAAHPWCHLLGETLTRVGVQWRFNRPNSVSIARRASVAALEAQVGPKR